MILRKSEERGRGNISWLKSFHTFSFADYYDPEWIHFRALRVMNDDVIAAGKGFGMHPHENMEILTYVLSGELEHRDSMGNGSVIRAGDMQYMSAGSGVQHSEWNASASEPVHLLQMWVIPSEKGAEPRYAEKSLAQIAKNAWHCVASGTGRDGSIEVRQDMELFLARLEKQKELNYQVPAGRAVWMHVATGAIECNGQELRAGDAIGVKNAETLALVAKQESQILLYNLN